MGSFQLTWRPHRGGHLALGHERGCIAGGASAFSRPAALSRLHAGGALRPRTAAELTEDRMAWGERFAA